MGYSAAHLISNDVLTTLRLESVGVELFKTPHIQKSILGTGASGLVKLCVTGKTGGVLAYSNETSHTCD